MDWVAQEFAIIAYLSKEPLLIACYEMPGDPYVNLGIILGLMPPGSGKDHPLREPLKTCILGLFYGRGVRSIAAATHHRTHYIQSVVNTFWAKCPRARRWSEGYVDRLFLFDQISTRCGWMVHRHRETKVTTARNFPVQANAAEMMRWAACLAYENGVPLNCPVHDAFLGEGRLEDQDSIVATQAASMERGSAIILDGAIVRVESHVFRYPDRFMDDKGWKKWQRITATIDTTLGNPPARIA
jgi:hypothetical protein